MNKYNFVANKQDKLLKFLEYNLNGYNYSQLVRALRQKDIIVNGQRVKENVKINLGDSVEIYLPESNKSFYKVVYEDENVILFNKQKGIEVCDGDFNIKEEYKKQNGTQIYAIHRIDRNTTGLVIFAKSLKVESELTKLFKTQKVEKFYYAYVFGKPKQSAVLSSYLLKNKDTSSVKIFDSLVEGSVSITTEYFLVSSFDEYSLLTVKIVEGKTHQIRAHLAHYGMFIVGDEKYGDTVLNKKFKSKSQMLQAYKIVFNVPKGNFLEYLNSKNFEIKNEMIL